MDLDNGFKEHFGAAIMNLAFLGFLWNLGSQLDYVKKYSHISHLFYDIKIRALLNKCRVSEYCNAAMLKEKTKNLFFWVEAKECYSWSNYLQVRCRLLILHSVHPSSFCCEEGWTSYQIFKDGGGGAERTSIFGGGSLRKRGWPFARGVAIFI